MVYVPLTQYPSSDSPVVVKTARDPLGFVNLVRAAVRSFDRDQPIYDIQTLEQRLAQSLARDRFSALLLGIFSALAVVLAACGLYGLMSYVVARRTHEMGIRMALGAGIGDILKLILHQGMKTAVIGVGLGLLGTFASARLVESLLFGISATDPFTLGIVTLLLAVVAFLACWIPARAAASVNPIVALRYQ
jgi:putative ABC transport system permease protein